MRFDVPAEVAFDYLVDPVNRPAWQSSLRRVDGVSGPVAVGQRWIDVTVPGLKPAMETTELDRPRRWTEVGTWWRVSATLTLTFTAVGADACDVGVSFVLRGRGLAAPVGPLLTLVSPPAVRADLVRAAGILAGGS